MKIESLSKIPMVAIKNQSSLIRLSHQNYLCTRNHMNQFNIFRISSKVMPANYCTWRQLLNARTKFIKPIEASQILWMILSSFTHLHLTLSVLLRYFTPFKLITDQIWTVPKMNIPDWLNSCLLLSKQYCHQQTWIYLKHVFL